MPVARQEINGKRSRSAAASPRGRGRGVVLDGADPWARLEESAVAGEVAAVDLDAALGNGSNAGVIRGMLRRAPCRVGGGIRDLDTARAWLDAGATKIMIG